MATDRNRRTRCAIAGAMEGPGLLRGGQSGRATNQARNPRGPMP